MESFDTDELEAQFFEDISTVSWVARDGTRTPIYKMDDDHLLAAERFARGDGASTPGPLFRLDSYGKRSAAGELMLSILRYQIQKRGLERLPPFRPTPVYWCSCGETREGPGSVVVWLTAHLKHGSVQQLSHDDAQVLR